MAQLDRILGEAHDTQRRMREVVKGSGDGAAREIVQLRTHLATLIADTMHAIKADSRLQVKPDMAREFDARFFDMRQTLAQHQARWRRSNIDEDPAAYRRATDELGRKLDDFFGWAIRTLAAL
jgi:hypothetical protein